MKDIKFEKASLEEKKCMLDQLNQDLEKVKQTIKKTELIINTDIKEILNEKEVNYKRIFTETSKQTEQNLEISIRKLYDIKMKLYQIMHSCEM